MSPQGFKYLKGVASNWSPKYTYNNKEVLCLFVCFFKYATSGLDGLIMWNTFLPMRMCAGGRTRVWKEYLSSVEKMCVVQMLFVIKDVIYFTDQASAKYVRIVVSHYMLFSIYFLWYYVISIKMDKFCKSFVVVLGKFSVPKMAFILWSFPLSLLPDLWGKLSLLCRLTTYVECR